MTNGATWARQRRMIDPAFEGGQLKDSFPAMWGATEAMAARLTEGWAEVEALTSHAAADVIFRTLFSRPDRGSGGGRGLHRLSRPISVRRLS